MKGGKYFLSVVSSIHHLKHLILIKLLSLRKQEFSSNHSHLKLTLIEIKELVVEILLRVSVTFLANQNHFFTRFVVTKNDGSKISISHFSISNNFKQKILEESKLYLFRNPKANQRLLSAFLS